VVWKDLVAEVRSKELLSAMLVFSLIVTVIFSFALELRLDRAGLVAPGMLWSTFAFAGTLGLNRSLAIEKDRGCLDGLLQCPVDRSALYFGKAIGNLLFMLIVEALVLPLFTVLFNVMLLNAGVALVVLVGTIGFAGAVPGHDPFNPGRSKGDAGGSGWASGGECHRLDRHPGRL
jgi:heme exporter protein B